ncbi:unnamed protein product [Ixodes hexagonus]
MEKYSPRKDVDELVLNCRNLHHNSPAILVEAVDVTRAHKRLSHLPGHLEPKPFLMEGLSLVFVSLALFFLSGGITMTVLSLTLEPRSSSLTEFYEIPTFVIGVCITSVSCIVIATVIILKCCKK